MQQVFIGREKELADLEELYLQGRFQLFVLYGRRRVGKTTLLNEFCKDKDAIFYSAEQSNNKLNLEKFSSLVFQFYAENSLEPFSSWSNALSYIDERQGNKKLVLVIDEFPYLVKKNRALWTLGSATVSLMLLYAAGCVYSHGDWFVMAVLGTLLGEAVVFLPFVLRSEQLEKYVRNSKGLVCMAADSVLTFACVVFGTLKYGDVVDLRDGMLATVTCVALVWAVFLIIRYLKVNGFFKGALCFVASAVWVVAMTVLSNAWNGMKLSEIFSVKGADNSRYDVIVCLCLAGVAAVLGIAGVVYKFARKRSQDR